MTAPDDPYTALLDELAAVREHLTRLDTRETAHHATLTAQLTTLTSPTGADDEPGGYQPRFGLLAQLDRAEARVSVIHSADGRHGTGASQLAAAYARAKLEAGWRLVAWVNATTAGNMRAGLAAVAEAAGLADEDSRLGGTDAPAAVRRWLSSEYSS